MSTNTEVLERQEAFSASLNYLKPKNAKALSDVLNALLADTFALYIKTKNFHWHISGPHFRDYHLLLDEQATQIFAITDDIAERVRKIGAPPFAPLAILRGCSGLGTTMLATWMHRTCSPNYSKTIRRWC